ncbi:MAG: RHS repeat-associated core domain-containing protein [Candidatus Dormiibacterota bacterium]
MAFPDTAPQRAACAWSRALGGGRRDTSRLPRVGGRRSSRARPALETGSRFQGQYRDNESGLYYLRARYYDPTVGQFLTIDPDVATTLSPYGYVAGNPLNAIDPSGALEDASSRGGFGYYTSGPYRCEADLDGGPALCETGGGQLEPFGSGVPGASLGRLALGDAVGVAGLHHGSRLQAESSREMAVREARCST